MNERTNEKSEAAGRAGYVWRTEEIVSNAAAFLREKGSEARRELVRTTVGIHRLLNGVRP